MEIKGNLLGNQRDLQKIKVEIKGGDPKAPTDCFDVDDARW